MRFRRQLNHCIYVRGLLLAHIERCPLRVRGLGIAAKRLVDDRPKPVQRLRRRRVEIG
jgi:hypothetical protein